MASRRLRDPNIIPSTKRAQCRAMVCRWDGRLQQTTVVSQKAVNVNSSENRRTPIDSFIEALRYRLSAYNIMTEFLATA